MKISEGTKISELINFSPEAIEVIASINPHFEKLRNPILRKVLASRVTIKDAAKIGGCSVDVFFERLSTIGFDSDKSPGKIDPVVSSEFTLPLDARVASLDVRPAIQSGKDPFLDIIAALDLIGPGEYLELINSFEPVPLLTLLKEKKFECYVQNTASSVTTYVLKTTSSLPLQTKKPSANAEFEKKLNEYTGRLKRIDVSALQMPGPMLAILDELKTLPEGFALQVRHRRIPHLLLPELKERGINILVQEQKDGNIHLLIYK